MQKLRASTWQKIRRQKFKSMGVCTYCGKNPPAQYKTRCAACIKKLWKPHTREHDKSAYSEYTHRLKLAAYNAYGGAICNCCGDTEYRFLTIDHINNDGAQHRKSIDPKSNKGSSAIYKWLKKNGYPPGFQVLCMSCNFGKYTNKGACPHQDGNNMKPLTIKSIYLCGPIDIGDDIKWKDLLADKIRIAGLDISLFDPAAAFSVVGEMTERMSMYIEGINDCAMNKADLVIASLPAGVQTVGTIVEIDRCASTNKELWLLSNIKVNKSAYLLNRIMNNNIIPLADTTAASIDEALNNIVAKLITRNK